MTSYVHTQSFAIEQQNRINHLLKMLSNKIENAPSPIKSEIHAKVKHLETVRFNAFTADQVAADITKACNMIENMVNDYDKKQRQQQLNSSHRSNSITNSNMPHDMSYKSYKDCWYWNKIREMILEYLKKADINEYDPVVAAILNHISEDFSYVEIDKNMCYNIRSNKVQELYNKIYDSYLSNDHKHKLVWSCVDQLINHTVNAAKSVSNGNDIEINTSSLVTHFHELIGQNLDEYVHIYNNTYYPKNYDDFTKLIKDTIPTHTTISTLSLSYFTVNWDSWNSLYTRLDNHLANSKIVDRQKHVVELLNVFNKAFKIQTQVNIRDFCSMQIPYEKECELVYQYLPTDNKTIYYWYKVDDLINTTVKSFGYNFSTGELATVYDIVHNKLLESNYLTVSYGGSQITFYGKYSQVYNVITELLAKIYLYNYQNYIVTKNQQYYYTETELITINKSVCKELLKLGISINDVNKVYDTINTIFNNIWQYLPIRHKIIEILDSRLISYDDDTVLKILQSVYSNWNRFNFDRDNWGRGVINSNSIQALNDLIYEIV